MNFKKILECERLVESTSRKMNTVRPFFARSLFFTNKNQVFLWCLLIEKKRDWWLQMNPPLKRTLHCLLSNWLHATPQPQEKIDAELFCKTVTKKAHICQNLFFPIFFKWSSFFLHPPIFLIFFVVSLELRSRYQKIPFVTNQNCDSLKKITQPWMLTKLF